MGTPATPGTERQVHQGHEHSCCWQRLRGSSAVRHRGQALLGREKLEQGEARVDVAWRGRQMLVSPPGRPAVDRRGQGRSPQGARGLRKRGTKAERSPAAWPADAWGQRRRAGGASNRERAPHRSVAPECTLLTLTTSGACRQGAHGRAQDTLDALLTRPSRAHGWDLRAGWKVNQDNRHRQPLRNQGGCSPTVDGSELSM